MPDTISRLIQFLYLLGRDKLALGEIAQVIAQTSPERASFTNSQLAGWAAEQARTLTKPAQGESEGPAPSQSNHAHARESGPYYRYEREDGAYCVGMKLAGGRHHVAVVTGPGYAWDVAQEIANALNLLHQGRAGTAGVGASLESFSMNARGTISWPETGQALDLSPNLRALGWFQRQAVPCRRAEEAFASVVCGYGTERRFMPRVMESMRRAGLYIATAEELDPPVCRLQLPDGSVPTNAAEAAQGWYNAYQGERSLRGECESNRVSQRQTIAAYQDAEAEWTIERAVGQRQLEALQAVVRQCGECFREYERLRQAQADSETGVAPVMGAATKAYSNRLMAELCEGALAGEDAPDGGPEGSGLPDKPEGPSAEARDRADCYGAGCDEFPGLRAKAGTVAVSIGEAEGFDRYAWDRHPVEAPPLVDASPALGEVGAAMASRMTEAARPARHGRIEGPDGRDTRRGASSSQREPRRPCRGDHCRGPRPSGKAWVMVTADTKSFVALALHYAK